MPEFTVNRPAFKTFERIAWNPRAIALPANGVIIIPDPGDVLRYLQRDRLFG